MDVLIILQVLVNGLLLGGIYALVGVGLTIIYGAMDIINFAQGDLLMLGMYSSYWLFTIWGIDPLLSLPLSALLLFLVGLCVQRSLIQQVLGKPPASQIFITFGLLIFLENVALILWTPKARSIVTGYTYAVMKLGGVRVLVPSFVSFMISVGFCCLLYFFLSKTLTGMALRATSQDRQAAMLMGINVNHMYLFAFGIGSACAGVAGGLVSTFYHVSPTSGLAFTLVAFIVCVLGGMGNYVGTFFAGLIIGLTEALTGFFVSPAYKHLGAFVIFVLILLFRPTGLFGKEERR